MSFRPDALAAALDGALRDRAHAVAVEIGGRRIVVAVDRPEGIRIVEAIFGPCCSLTPAPAGAAAPDGAWHFVSAEVPGLAAVAAAVAAAGGRPVTIRRWAGDDDAQRYDVDDGVSVVVHRRPFEGLTVLLRDRRRVFYLRPSPAFDVPHTEHAVKYPLRVALRVGGFAQVHAAACSFEGRGLLLMGRRRAGKTTLLVQLVRRGALQVANDLSFVRRTAAGGCEMIAFPHMTRIGPETVADSDVLRERLAAEERTGDYLRSPVFNGGKEELYHPVLERVWGRDPLCRVAPLDAVVFPALDVHRDDSVAVPLPVDEAVERVRTALVTDPPLPDWLPILTADELLAVHTARADEVAPRVPAAYELRFGPARTDPATALARALAAVPAR